MTLAGRVVVVTGSAAGIGAATAQLLREAGATVIGIDRDPTGAGHGLAGFVPADLSVPADIDRAVAQLPDRVDGLCAVAGVPGTAGRDLVRDVNYLGVRHLAGRVAERMTAGGSIACAASIAGHGWPARLSGHLALAEAATFEDGRAWCEGHPVDDAQAYPFFKEALVVWAMRSAGAFRGRGIRVNCVSPGPVETGILADFRESLGTAKVQADIDRVGRAGLPADVAPVFAFLMSSGSAWVTGANLPCDGGLAAMVATADAGDAGVAPVAATGAGASR